MLVNEHDIFGQMYKFLEKDNLSKLIQKKIENLKYLVFTEIKNIFWKLLIK